MKILYVDLQYDYGNPKRGLNEIGQLGFKKSFEELGHEVVPFYWDQYIENAGPMQHKLLAFAGEVKPDLIFFCLFRDQFAHETLQKLKRQYTTLNWFGDDTWRFDDFTSRYANDFSYCVTTDKFSIPKYHAIGQKNVIHSQWAALEVDPPESLAVDYRYEVTFVGGMNYYRRWFVKELKKRGINVQAFGHGWPNGAVSLGKMREIFLHSKINLNLSNSKSYDLRYVLSHPIHLAHTLRTKKVASQIKARSFEIPYYGGFQLADFAPGLEDYLNVGEDLVCYKDIDEAASLIKFYLSSEGERERIKQCGHLKVVGQHSYKNRIEQIIRAIVIRNE